ncbi:antitoxin Xre/MbcA/ParS toxin-binding domain-containing protein [Roseibacillus ishigakijimensis]|uniref:DUF2384 domain-containing protein n=1 Tax=Roseibacillus ishigakijimensis TaxID=454146 RepID=A0A934RNK4_9BACT|nr:antitoxin Xre/MbcA/ParS toxin-binding domain-containing protein [Roseibacillus ishigakijimensis]MBK1832603.1 DUF2384 domain-containing protein [Roseibacillus ishigakijimensis]
MNYFETNVVKGFLPEIQPSGIVAEQPLGHTLPLVELLREGLPFQEFRALQALLAIPEEELGRLLGMSAATLGRRKKAPRLTMAESERVVRFARLFGLAMEVFDNEEETARDWLKTENPGTAGERPLAYADTEFGAREVETLLGRLDHGIY